MSRSGRLCDGLNHSRLCHRPLTPIFLRRAHSETEQGGRGGEQPEPEAAGNRGRSSRTGAGQGERLPEVPGDHAGRICATQDHHHVFVVLIRIGSGERPNERSDGHSADSRPASVRTGHPVLDGAQPTGAAAELDLRDRGGRKHTDFQ